MEPFLPQVYNLCGIMSVLFFMFAIQAQHLCSDVTPPAGGAINELDNFKTVLSSMRMLYQLCTGGSMFGANNECRQEHGPHIMVFFGAFFFLASLLCVNLFVALLLDK